MHDHAFEEMHDAFLENCARVVLKDLGHFSLFTMVNEESFSLLRKYVDAFTCNPLSLVQLCRKMVSINGSGG